MISAQNSGEHHQYLLGVIRTFLTCMEIVTVRLIKVKENKNYLIIHPAKWVVVNHLHQLLVIFEQLYSYKTRFLLI